MYVWTVAASAALAAIRSLAAKAAKAATVQTPLLICQNTISLLIYDSKMSIDGKMSTDYTVIYRTHFHAFSKIASWNWYDSC